MTIWLNSMTSFIRIHKAVNLLRGPSGEAVSSEVSEESSPASGARLDSKSASDAPRFGPTSQELCAWLSQPWTLPVAQCFHSIFPLEKGLFHVSSKLLTCFLHSTYWVSPKLPATGLKCVCNLSHLGQISSLVPLHLEVEHENSWVSTWLWPVVGTKDGKLTGRTEWEVLHPYPMQCLNQS